MDTRGTGHPISWRVFFSFLAVLALLSMIPVHGIDYAAAESDAAEVSTKEQFEAALADSSIHTIILTADIDSGFTPSAKEMPAARRKTVNRVLTIRSAEGQKHTLSGYGFTVDGYSSEAALSFENIIIHGKIPERCGYAIDYSNDYCLMIVHGPKATLNFNDGARVQNFHNQHAAVFLLEDKAVLNVNEGCEMYNLGAGYGIFRVDGRWGYENGQLPKKVVKLVKKLADLQRKQVEIIRWGTNGEKTPDELYPLKNEQFETGTKLVDELFSTQFATIEIGVGFSEDDSFADDLHMMGLYFLERYALERMMSDITGEKLDEDLYYAGTYLLHQSLLVSEEEDDEDFIGDYEGDDEDLMAWLENMPVDGQDSKEEKQPDGKVIQMFGEKKGKKK